MFFFLYRVTPTRTTTSTVAFGEKETARVELTPFYAPINRNELNKYTNTHTINYESRQIETIANCIEGNLRSYGLPPAPLHLSVREPNRADPLHSSAMRPVRQLSNLTLQWTIMRILRQSPLEENNEEMLTNRKGCDFPIHTYTYTKCAQCQG